MKKLTALLLAALMVFSLTACAGQNAEPEPTTAPTTQPTTQPATEPTTEPTEPPVVLPEKFDPVLCAPLVGTWTAEVVLDGSLMNMLDMEGSVSYKLTYTFSEYGAYTITSDEAEVAAALDSYQAMLQAHMIKSLYSKFYAECRLQGMGSSRIEKAWEEGKKAEAEQSAANFVAQINLASRIKAVKRLGDYYVEQGLLNISLPSGYYETSGYTLEDGVLTLTDSDNQAFYGPLGVNFPLQMTVVTE